MKKVDVISRIKSLGAEKLGQGNHILLYGSRARGDNKNDSDWDILVLLDKPAIEQSDYDGICYQLTSLGWELGEMIIPVLYTKNEWESNSFTPFYQNVKQDGIQLI